MKDCIRRKLPVFFLCLIMVVGAVLFTGCAKDDSAEDEINKNNEKQSRPTQTFVMYVMRGKDYDGDPEAQKAQEEQEQAVEDAINKILKAEFKTRLDIRFVSEKDYYDTLEAEIKAMKEAQDNAGSSGGGSSNSESESVTEEEVVLNQYGIPELKYPATAEHQVDIFFLGGEDRYNEYIDNEWLMAVDSELKAGSKILDDYISRPFIIAAAAAPAGNGSTYAIPNNRVIGEYTYLLLNKELMTKYYYGTSDITSLTDAKAFLTDVKNNEPDYDPIAFDSCRTPSLVHYWSIDPTTGEWDPSRFSLIGCTYNSSFTYAKTKGDKSETTSNYLTFSSLFTRTAYTNQLLALKYYDAYGFYADENSNKKFALSVVKGGPEILDEYGDDYYINVIDYPRATSEELYASMFGLCAYSKGDVSRLMEVVTYLNTNSEFRNLLQYGIANVNYTYDENVGVKRTSDNRYFMDLNKTGNVFVAYPEEGMSLDVWDYGKKQNHDAKIDCTLGFSFVREAGSLDKIDTASIKKIWDASKEAEEELAKITDYDEYAAKLSEYATKFRNNTELKIQSYTTPKREQKEGDPLFPITVYYGWLEASGFISNEQ